MSNKIVPGIYRSVIDDVISSIKPDFEEYGVDNEVLTQLQHKWEMKILASHVADFDAPPAPTAPAMMQTHTLPTMPPQHLAYPPHPMHMMGYPPPHNLYSQPQQAGTVKSEPVDTRFALSAPPVGYTLPPLPGPQLAVRGQPMTHPGGGQSSVLSFPTAPTARTYVPPAGPNSHNSTTNPRIPQVDGSSAASDSDDENDNSPSPGPSRSYPSHPSHPSLPAPPVPAAPVDDEAINSDLDDSDTDGDDGDDETGGTAGGVGETDIVFCTYDKVARVKNKWKCVLKDGMIHVNGRDYLFAKCSGEFEW